MQGLVSYVLKSYQSDIYTRGVVIGHDHRHHSEAFAEITAKVFASQNIPVKFFKEIAATPLVAYATKKLHAFCGIMITASHNPKDDNGYKLYWENGAQLLSPFDKYIATSIEENRTLWPKVEDMSMDGVEFIDAAMSAAYFNDLKTLKNPLATVHSPARKLIYTPMHGVGLKFAEKVFETFEFAPFTATASQQDPNPDFPTVKFPNPEEKGAFVREI